MKDVDALVEDLLLYREGWRTDEEHEVFLEAGARLHEAGKLVLLKRLRERLDNQISEKEKSK